MESFIYSAISIAIIGLIIYFVVIKPKKNKKEGSSPSERETAQKEAKTVNLNATYIEGIDYLREGQECKLYADGEKLTIVASKTDEFNISLDQIVNIGKITKKEIESKNKSVIGRGIAGSLVGLGFLGALSGVGQKTKKKSKVFLIINYKSKESNDIKAISFGLMFDGYDSDQFVKKVSKRLTKETINL